MKSLLGLRELTRATMRERGRIEGEIMQRRLDEEHQAETLGFLLDGLGVESLSELHRLVETGRAVETAREAFCIECGEPMYSETSTRNGLPRHILCPRDLREIRRG